MNQMQSSSEDFLYLDAANWTAEDQDNAMDTKQEFIDKNLLSEQTTIHSGPQATQFKVKGRNRNKPCPCGSGIKYKYCCGKKN